MIDPVEAGRYHEETVAKHQEREAELLEALGALTEEMQVMRIAILANCGGDSNHNLAQALDWLMMEYKRLKAIVERRNTP